MLRGRRGDKKPAGLREPTAMARLSVIGHDGYGRRGNSVKAPAARASAANPARPEAKNEWRPGRCCAVARLTNPATPSRSPRTDRPEFRRNGRVALNPFGGGLRFATAVLIGLLAVACVAIVQHSTTSHRTPVFDAGDLSRQSPGPIERDVIVTGTWTATAPAEQSHLLVILCGEGVGRADCHFESVAVADRSSVERRLASGEIVIRGRCERVSGGIAVLRDCRLLDPATMAE
jgi:hypothetical protein